MKLPADSILTKREKLIVTIYGPYGEWLPKLRRISKYLRESHGFLDCLPVVDRSGFRKRLEFEKVAVYIRNKSYYFLEISHVNVFIFYCGAFTSSVDFELKHEIDNLPQKIESSIVLTDSNCKMGKVFQGDVNVAKIKSEPFDGQSRNPEKEISDIANAYCLNILKRDFHLI